MEQQRNRKRRKEVSDNIPLSKQELVNCLIYWSSARI